MATSDGGDCDAVSGGRAPASNGAHAGGRPASSLVVGPACGARFVWRRPCNFEAKMCARTCARGGGCRICELLSVVSHCWSAAAARCPNAVAHSSNSLLLFSFPASDAMRPPTLRTEVAVDRLADGAVVAPPAVGALPKQHLCDPRGTRGAPHDRAQAARAGDFGPGPRLPGPDAKGSAPS